MNTVRNTFIALATLMIAIGCSTSVAPIVETTPCGRTILNYDADAYNQLPTDAQAVKAVSIEGSCLSIQFAYSGCDIHDIDLMFRPKSGETEEGIELKVKHLNDDLCEAFFQHVETFDLNSISGLSSGEEISVSIVDWNETFTFTKS